MHFTFALFRGLDRSKKYDYVKTEWKQINDVPDNNFKPLADQLIQSGQSFNIDGLAGTGKSYLIKELQEALKKLGKQVISVAPTNKASVLINGQTIHRFFRQ